MYTPGSRPSTAGASGREGRASFMTIHSHTNHNTNNHNKNNTTTTTTTNNNTNNNDANNDDNNNTKSTANDIACR